MIGRDYKRRRLSINFKRIVPAHYHLGMWRVQYLQKSCCLCFINLATTQSQNKSRNTSVKKHSALPASPNIITQISNKFSASLLCSDCHHDTQWLPSGLKIDIISNTSTSTQSFGTPQLSESLESKQSIEIHSATIYQGYIQSAIVAFKYKEDITALPVLVHAIRQLPRPLGLYDKNSVIVAVPTTNLRLKKRGFDPVAILSYYLSQHWGIPIWNGVSRVDNVVSQQGLTKNERLDNIKDAFQVNCSIPTKNIILFDDVVTTGSTLKALASCLGEFDNQRQVSAYSLALANQ